MRKTIFSTMLTMILIVAVVMTAQAQYDDVYFDPNRDAPASYAKGKRYDYTNSNSRSAGEYTYDDKSFDYEESDRSSLQADDEYDYYYTSRIRRFNRPLYGFNYFDPYYVDVAYYDPFVTPGATVLIYDNFNSFGAYNSWRRWNRWNNVNRFSTWGWQPYTPFYNNWSWNRFNNNGFNSWDPWLGSSFNNNFAVNNFYGVGGGYVSNLYCPPAWGNGAGTTYNTVNVINNNNANPNGTYYGPRSSGTTYTPNDNGRSRFLETPREANTAPVRAVTNTNERNRNTITAPANRPAPTRTYEAPRSSPAPTRTYESPRSTPAPTRTYEAPRSTPAPTRTYEAPRSTPAPTRTYEAPRSTPAPTRTYEAPRSSPAPTRSYEAPRSSSPAPASAPIRTRGN
jgi:hypothetical protein